MSERAISREGERWVGAFDATTDPALRSWVDVDPGSDFPIQNLPLGVIETDRSTARCGLAIGAQVVDLARLAEAGAFDGIVPHARVVFSAPALNAFLALGRHVWRAFRERMSALLSVHASAEARTIVAPCLLPMRDVAMRMPCTIGDYIDFYASLEHATNLGRILRPSGDALLPNYRHIPVGYHGRAGTVVPSGTAIVRPSGQVVQAGGSAPAYVPTQMLDIETEMGLVTGAGPPMGTAVRIDDARDLAYGYVLLNDWSARDIQAWEYQPLGPFLSKSFATSISPWVVSLDALEPFRVAGPSQEPAPLPYLRASQSWAYDIAITARLATPRMRTRNQPSQTIVETNLRGMYWHFAQQLAHATANGASVRAGDLFGTGTISGSEPRAYGSLIELTWRGRDPLAIGDETRTFLEDGDTVDMRAVCLRDGVRIGFGELVGTISPAR